MKLKKVDVDNCGGGWTGLAMAKELATRASLEIVVLERGPTRSLAEYTNSMDEVDYSLRLRMMQNSAEETLTHRHTSKDTAVPGEHWAGVANRYPEDTFILKTALKQRFGNARMPEGLAAQDWSVTWKDIEPYYSKAETMMGIGGNAGNVRGRLIPGGNIFEGPRTKEYPVGPHRQTLPMTVFEKTAANLGYHPYINPAAALPFDYKNPDGIFRPGCAYCGQNVPLRFFTAEEAKAVTAAAERIFPADSDTPGATDAAVVIYIDRQLAGPHGRDKYRCTKGPWLKSGPEHGNQDKATPRELYREGIPTLGPDFATQSPEEQDRRLAALEKTSFFAQLRAHTIEGMFCDPLHGGNANLVGWKMINFPGPVMSYRLESEQTAQRTPKSLVQITGRKIQGWEDEA